MSHSSDSSRVIAPKRSGFHYFAVGWQLIRQPNIRHFVILPLLVNVLLMGGAFLWLFNRLNEWIPAMMSDVPSWLQWLNFLLWPLIVISVLLIFSYLFSTIANLIAAPFSGLLAEQVEAQLTGKPAPDTGIMDIAKDIPRIMSREWRKLMYYIPRMLLLLLLHLVPGIGQTVAPVLWFLFSGWMLCIQYCDYPFDNHKVSFEHMRQALRQDKTHNLQFGTLVGLCTMIPFLNLVIMPVAVCGATAIWVDRYRGQFVGIAQSKK